MIDSRHLKYVRPTSGFNISNGFNSRDTIIQEFVVLLISSFLHEFFLHHLITL